VDQEIICERRGPVLVVSFNRPRTLNSFREETYARLRTVLDDFNADRALRALVLTGVGRAFSSGHDLGEAQRDSVADSGEQERRLEELQDITRLLLASPKPTVAAINGPAVGFGAEITLACDVRLVDPSAYFMFPELARGLYFTNAALELLPRLVGPTRAALLLLTGERMLAEPAVASGLASRLTPPGAVLAEALTLATTLCELPPAALAATLAALRARGAEAVNHALRLEVQTVLKLFGDGAGAGHVRQV
jgi:enoyl-CoA hydratase/carnithine racemase